MKAFSIDVAKQAVIERIGVRLLGRVNAADLAAFPVCTACSALLHQPADLLIGIRTACTGKIHLVGHLARMAEIDHFADLCIISADFKRQPHTA